MTANYNGLWKLLIDRKRKCADLRDIAGINTTTVAKPGKECVFWNVWIGFVLR